MRKRPPKGFFEKASKAATDANFPEKQKIMVGAQSVQAPTLVAGSKDRFDAEMAMFEQDLGPDIMMEKSDLQVEIASIDAAVTGQDPQYGESEDDDLERQGQERQLEQIKYERKFIKLKQKRATAHLQKKKAAPIPKVVKRILFDEENE